MNENEKNTFPSKIDWKSIDEVTRKWAIMSQFEQDQENYEKLKDQYE